MKELKEQLFHNLENIGYKASIVSVTHLDELLEEIDDKRQRGLLSLEVIKEYEQDFNFDNSGKLKKARSIVLVAVPQLPTGVTFSWKGKDRTFPIPPTYLHARKINNQVLALLKEFLNPAGYDATVALLPKKLLAARSGLAFYGKNNIAFIPGIGFYHRLVSFFSDLPVSEETWIEPRMIRMCRNCRACLTGCPTGAISSERFLLHAERCITLHNEKPLSTPFPEWIDPSWHNCLVGCLLCQRVCPVNKRFLSNTVEGPCFSEEETELLLNGTPEEKIPPETIKKLKEADLTEIVEVFPRNLRVLLSGQELPDLQGVEVFSLR